MTTTTTTKITPTEEQREAARMMKRCGWCANDFGLMSPCSHCDDTGQIVDEAATLHVATLLAEREATLREEHHRACELVAAMHTAAVGSVRGPIVGVVEDVVAVRERAEKAEGELAAALKGHEVLVGQKRDKHDLAMLALTRAEVAEEAQRVTERSFVAAIVERDHARANLATLQREHDTLVKATENTRAALKKALGLTEWKPLAALVDGVVALRERDDLDAAIAERDHARANLATVQREHDALVKAWERHRSALAKALGATEWKPLGDLIDGVVDLADGLTSARAEVASLREYRAAQERGEDYWTGIRDENTSLRGEVARLTAERDDAVAINAENARDAEEVTRDVIAQMEKDRLALAASRAEVEALRELLRDSSDELHSLVNYDAGLNYGGPYNVDDADMLAKRIDAALSSTPAPASASMGKPATPPFIAGCDAFSSSADRDRAVLAWAAGAGLTMWFVESSDGSMCLVGGEASARMIADALNSPARAETATPFTDEGSNGFVERAGKGAATPTTEGGAT